MANIFQISPLNPIRFYNAPNPEDPTKRGLPYDLPFVLYYQEPRDGSYDFEHSKHKCYAQKFTIYDNTKIQILSDYDQITATIRDEISKQIIVTLNVVQVDTLIVGQTFLVYEIDVPFYELTQEGLYYVELKYFKDEIETDVVIISEVLDLKKDHPETMLFTYRNSVNNFDIIFDTGIEFNIRVEGTIENFEPASEDESYIDQKRNVTKLYSLPYRLFTLFVGNAPGLPAWMNDKVNRIMSCNIIQIDSAYFEKNDGAEWEFSRQDDYPFFGMNIQIAPVENKFSNQYATINNSYPDLETLHVITTNVTVDLAEAPPNSSSELDLFGYNTIAGDVVFIGIPSTQIIPTGTRYSAFCLFNGVIRIRFYNESSIAVDPASTTFNIKVYRQTTII